MPGEGQKDHGVEGRLVVGGGGVAVASGEEMSLFFSVVDLNSVHCRVGVCLKSCWASAFECLHWSRKFDWFHAYLLDLLDYLP